MAQRLTLAADAAAAATRPLLAIARKPPRVQNTDTPATMTRLIKKPLAEMPMRITTPRLIMRELRLSDAGRFSELASDADVARMTSSFPHPLPPIFAEFFIMRFIERRRAGLAYPYAITLQGSDDILGMMDIFKNGAGQWEIGYWLGRPSWGQGYATEAGAAILDLARSALGITEVHAGVYVGNESSERVLTKLGFKRTHETDNLFSMARLQKAPGQRYIRTAPS